MKVNINYSASIILTDSGAKILNTFHNKYNIHTSYKEGDIYKSPLWEIMNIFGSHFNIGFNSLHFKDNDIEL